MIYSHVNQDHNPLTSSRDAYWARWGAGYFYQKQEAFDAYDARLSYILDYKGVYSGKVWKNWPQAIFSFNIQVNSPNQVF